MTVTGVLVGVVIGVAVTALYNLAHGAQLTRLGEDLKTEIQKIKL